jgi:hypothetical protein
MREEREVAIVCDLAKGKRVGGGNQVPSPVQKDFLTY